MPTTRNEEYRFTDVAPLTAASLAPAAPGAAVDAALLEQLRFPESDGSRMVLVDGRVRTELSDLSALPPSVYVGGVASAPAEALERLVGGWGGVQPAGGVRVTRSSVACRIGSRWLADASHGFLWPP